MIQVYVERDYSQDPELRKRHTAWLEDPHTQNVLSTMEYGSRAHQIRTSGMPTDDKLVKLGFIQGVQFALDKIRSLDVAQRSIQEPNENFVTDPTQ